MALVHLTEMGTSGAFTAQFQSFVKLVERSSFSVVLYSSASTWLLDFPFIPLSIFIISALSISLDALTRPSSTSVSVICVANQIPQRHFSLHTVYPIYLQALCACGNQLTHLLLLRLQSPASHLKTSLFPRIPILPGPSRPTERPYPLPDPGTSWESPSPSSPSIPVRAQPSFVFALLSYEPYI